MLTDHADDLRIMARWLSRRHRSSLEDVQQDLAAITLIHGHKFNPQTIGFRRWLSCYYSLHRTGRTNHPVPQFDVMPVRVDDRDPAEEAAGRDEQAVLLEAVNELPVDVRGVIVERFGLADGTPRPKTAIAAATGHCSQWVRSRQASGIAALRAKMSVTSFTVRLKTSPCV
ncbi:hypothetical protein BH11PLA2_BH11PLA2_43870 [soil metagenome]